MLDGLYLTAGVILECNQGLRSQCLKMEYQTLIKWSLSRQPTAWKKTTFLSSMELFWIKHNLISRHKKDCSVIYLLMSLALKHPVREMMQGTEEGRDRVSKRLRKSEMISSYYSVLMWVVWLDLVTQLMQCLMNNRDMKFVNFIFFIEMKLKEMTEAWHLYTSRQSRTFIKGWENKLIWTRVLNSGGVPKRCTGVGL